ncbi:VanZ family protein [Sinomonas atrocyanea]|uniref:VanZ family protein n=1 Tax=Sinomonas atrocyanea TaxID=37927 RepID=UPI00277ED1F3|nr:VanZ family protein [Sinomonas atrocyanea]MDQ0261635.1 glycopeptide antibiotics resistance protein [Sinomonas atrocyanea]MDR6621506.1 glycopeptide antibiotics resistance protein [Sinomonas atrocyanea]
MDVRPQPASAGEDDPRWRSATQRAKAETGIIFAVFALYTAFLLRLLLFSRAPGSERSLNLIPFASIAEIVSSHSSGTGRVAFANIAGNILIFIPLGFYVSWLRQRAAAWTTMLTVAVASAAVEVIQGVLAVGASDIDDVILNSVGGMLGVVAFRLLSATVRGQSLVRTAMAVVSVVTLPVWCYFFFVLRLHL